MRHRGLRKSALSLPEGCLGAPQITSQTRCWKPPADSGRFLRHAFVLHYVQDEKGDRATKQRQAHSTCPGSGLLLPRPLSRKWLTLLLPLLQLRKGNTSLFFFFFLKALLRMILELQRSEFLKERLNGDTAHRRPGSQTSRKMSHFIYVCCWYCCHPCSG